MKISVLSKVYDHISIKEIKKHLHISDNYDDDDFYLLGLIGVATDIVENDIEVNIAVANKQAKETVDGAESITVLDANLSGITSITVDGTAISASTYTVDTNDFDFTVSFNDKVTGEVIINYGVGYTAATILPIIKQAILIKIFGLYDNERSEYNTVNYSMNTAYTRMLNYYKKITWI